MMSRLESRRARASLKIGTVHIQGKIVDRQTASAVADALNLWALSTSDLIAQQGGDSSRFLCEMSYILRRSFDVVSLIQILKDACGLWRLVETPEAFQAFCARYTGLPELTPIVPCVIEFSITRSPFIFQIVHHYLAFLLKMPCDAPNLEEAAISDYRKVEDRLSSLELPTDTVGELRTIISEWFEDFRPIGLPEHGPGSTADAGSSLEAKELSLSSDELFNLCPEWIPWLDQSTPTFVRRSKVVLVPKTALSLRTISEEPATLQYWQRPVLRGFDRVFRTSELRYHVDLHDQTLSRDGALQASATGDASTLDLSAASDSVSLRLVEKVFPWHVLRFLIATRSTHTLLPDGTTLQLNKFAPMGSSVCFPLECTIFAACCELVIRRAHARASSRTAYRVYGDDIIINNEYVYDLIQVLESLGFVVNTAKSFTRNSFRESCGLFAINGVDITTPQIPRDHEALRASSHPNGHQRCIGMCNQFLMSGMFSARLYVLYNMRHTPLFVEFQPSFLTIPVDYCSHREFWSQGGVWSFYSCSNYLLDRRRCDPLKRIPKMHQTPPVALGLPGPVPLGSPRGSNDYGRGRVRYASPVTEGYAEKYSDNVRYQYWLRAAAMQHRSRTELQSPMGWKPRSRMRLKWHTA